MDRPEQVEGPHFAAVGRVPGIKDASAAHGLSDAGLNVLGANAKRLAVVDGDDGALLVVGVGVVVHINPTSLSAQTNEARHSARPNTKPPNTSDSHQKTRIGQWARKSAQSWALSSARRRRVTRRPLMTDHPAAAGGTKTRSTTRGGWTNSADGFQRCERARRQAAQPWRGALPKSHGPEPPRIEPAGVEGRAKTWTWRLRKQCVYGPKCHQPVYLLSTARVHNEQHLTTEAKNAAHHRPIAKSA